KGMAADQNPPHASQARAFAAFLRSLHVAAPVHSPPNPVPGVPLPPRAPRAAAPGMAPANPVRGVPLRQRAAAVEERLQRLASKTNLITSQIQHIWQMALHAPIDVPPTWLHGDLHPRNVLVEHGMIAGIIDWGDITSGD